MPLFLYRLMYWLWPRLVAAALVYAAGEWLIDFARS